MNWTEGYLSWSNTEMVISSLDYLGINHIRDAMPFPNWTLPIYERLADKGYSFTIPVDGVSFNKTGSFAETLDRINDLAVSRPGSVEAVEGPNEINTWTLNYKGQNTGTNLALGRDIQKLLWDQVHADPALAGIDVLNLTTGGLNGTQAAALGNMSDRADAGVWHVYYGQGDQPRANLVQNISYAKSIAPSDPVQITESGYYTAVNDMSWGGGGVTQTVQAKLLLNMFFDAADLGVERTFIYELLDNKRDVNAATDIEASFGLFRGDGSPKQAAVAIHNLNAILDDPSSAASSFATRSLNFNLSNMPTSAHSMLIEKANGAFNLVVWAEPDIWNQPSKTAIAAPNTSVTLNLASAASSIKLFDPMIGTSAIASAAEADRITFNLVDHPVIIEISRPGSSTTPVVTPPTGPDGKIGIQTVGSGPDLLVLRVSEDAYLGDAQFAVLVDGKQVGDTLTAHASKAAGQFENVEVRGDWGVGNHTVEIRFLNDRWDKTPLTDRNVYIEGASYNGVEVSAARVGSVIGSSTFSVNDTTPASVAAQRKLVLNVSEDAWNGNAQFTVAVDGKQVGGVMTATALHSTGASQAFEMTGAWGSGGHEVAVTFINDAWGGTAATDRNLYVDSVSLNGETYASTSAAMERNSTSMFFLGGATATKPEPADTIVLRLSEDAWNGDAQFVLTIDGKAISAPQSVTASQAAGQADTFVFTGDWAAGAHDVGVRFLNDAYGGTPPTDRNLYVKSIDVGGVRHALETPILSAGTANFNLQFA